MIWNQAAPGRIFLGNPLDELKDIANEQKPVLMCDGSGNIHGFWIVKQINETESYFDKFGNPKKVEFSLNLEKYGDTNENLFSILKGFL